MLSYIHTDVRLHAVLREGAAAMVQLNLGKIAIHKKWCFFLHFIQYYFLVRKKKDPDADLLLINIVFRGVLYLDERAWWLGIIFVSYGGGMVKHSKHVAQPCSPGRKNPHVFMFKRSHLFYFISQASSVVLGMALSVCIGGPPFCSRLTYLNNFWMDCHEHFKCMVPRGWIIMTLLIPLI